MLALIAALLPAWSLLLPNEGGAAPELTTDPIKWFDADNKPIPEPAEAKENKIWDFIDKTSVYQVGKVLDLGWTARRVGNLLGVVVPRQADNVNALDEVPNSSWFTNRNFLQPMTLDELAEGSIPRGSRAEIPGKASRFVARTFQKFQTTEQPKNGLRMGLAPFRNILSPLWPHEARF